MGRTKADEPGLLAYTESAQLATRKKDKAAAKKGQRGPGKDAGGKPVKVTYKRTSAVTPVQYTARRKKEAQLAFDDASRKEFLTGFEKRKQQRRARARRELETKARDELRAQRRLRHEQLRDRARENVQAERDFYGDAYEGGLGDEDRGSGGDHGAGGADADADADDQRHEPQIHEYDTGGHLTTVTTFDDWDPSAVDDELIAAEQGSKAKPKPQPKPQPKAQAQATLDSETQPQTAVKGKGGAKGQGRRPPPVPQEAAEVAPTDEIAALVDPEAQASMLETDAVLVRHLKRVDAHASALAKNKADFHYESKAERQAQLDKIKEKRLAAAEKRKEEKIARARADPASRRLKSHKHKKQIETRLPEHVRRARAKKENKRAAASAQKSG